MGFITAVTDIQNAAGLSYVEVNADGTRSPLVLRLDNGIAATFAKSGDLGIVTLEIDPDSSVRFVSVEVATLQVDTSANFDDAVAIGGVVTRTAIASGAVPTPAAGTAATFLDSGTGKMSVKTSDGNVHAYY